MNATTKKTNLTQEQIELNNEKLEVAKAQYGYSYKPCLYIETLKEDKKSLSKLAKVIEKTPTKKEIKEVKKNEYLVEINELDFELSKETLALIEDNLAISEEMKILRKKQLNNSKYIFMNINNELLNLKKSIDGNKDYKHIEFTKKGIINLLRIKLNTKKMAPDLMSSLNISMNYLAYNLSLNLEFASISQIKTIINAYELCINGAVEYAKITKNRIAKAKTQAAVIDLMADIKQAKKVYNKNQFEAKKTAIIAEYLEKQTKKTA